MKPQQERASEMPSRKIELKIRVTKNDVAPRVDNSKNFCRNSSFEFITRVLKIVKSNIELLTHSLNIYFLLSNY